MRCIVEYLNILTLRYSRLCYQQRVDRRKPHEAEEGLEERGGAGVEPRAFKTQLNSAADLHTVNCHITYREQHT